MNLACLAFMHSQFPNIYCFSPIVFFTKNLLHLNNHQVVKSWAKCMGLVMLEQEDALPTQTSRQIQSTGTYKKSSRPHQITLIAVISTN